MLQDLQKDLKEIRRELRECMGKTFPSKEYSATLILAMVGLHMTEAEIRKTQDMIERRRLIHEFNSRRQTIQTGIQRLWESYRQTGNRATAACTRALP